MVDIFAVLKQAPHAAVATLQPAPLTILLLDRCEFEAGKYGGQFFIFEWLF